MTAALDLSRASMRLQQGFAYWLDKADGGRPPPRAAIDPADFKRLLPFVVLIEVRRDPLDFVERVTGEVVLDHSERNSMNRPWRDYPGRGPGSAIWTHFETVVRTAAPLFQAVPYVGPKRDLVTVECVTCPLSADGRRVDRTLSFVDYIPRRSPED